MNPRKPLILLFLVFCIPAAEGLFGQEAMEPVELLADTLAQHVTVSPVTVFASALDNPFPVSSVTQVQIAQLTEPTIEPLLNATPGLWMQSGTLNTNRISIRGVGYREPYATTGIKIYLDEIPLTNGVGESSIEDIHPGILSGIDIWRGPASALWGSGLGGMIHLKTQIPESDQWQTKMQIGAFDRFSLDQGISLHYGKNDAWGTALYYQFLNDGGYRDNNQYRKNSLTWLQQWRGQKGITLNAFVHGIGLKAFIPSSINLYDYENNPSAAAPAWAAVMGNEDYTKWITGLNILYAPSKGWVYRGSVFGTFFNSDEVRPFNVLEENNTSAGMRHRFTLKVKDTGHVTLGMEYFNEHYVFSTYETLEGGLPGMQLTDEAERRSYLNAFAQTEWAFGMRWFLFGGINTAVSHLSNEELKANTPVDFFPTGGITYAIRKNWTVSTSVSRGYSSLSLEDMLDADGLINPDIVPETGWSEEFSIRYAMHNGSFVNLTVFNMNIRNTVLSRRINDVLFEKVNGGSSIHQGVELEYQWKSPTEKFTLEGAYTYGHYRFDEFVEGGSDYSGNRLPGTPLHHLYDKLTIMPWRKWKLYLDYHLVSDVFLNDANTVSAAGYQLFNTGLTYLMIDSDKWSGSVTANVHNIFDVAYSPMFQINATGLQPRYYYPGKPRSVYLNVAFTHKI